MTRTERYGARESAGAAGERIVITLTRGCIDNGYVLLSKHLNFFPQDAVGPANERDGQGTLLTVHFTGLPEPVPTDIPHNHKIFRRRRPCKEFFARHGLSEGDQVAIERLGAYEYRVSPVRTRAQLPP